jgi:hypothetical protein
LREGERGEGQAASGPVRRRWPEAHSSAWHGGAGQANDGSGDRGGRRAGERSGPRWPGGPRWASTN